MRKQIFENGEYYHLYNRGVDKRYITNCNATSDHFVIAAQAFNGDLVLGSIRDAKESGLLTVSADGIVTLHCPGRDPIPLVRLIAFCLNPNHLHIVAQQLTDGGVSKYMMRMGGAHARFVNALWGREGKLFQGPYKVSHIDSEEYLLYVSVYVNLNDRVHGICGEDLSLVRSSWNEYMSNKGGICHREPIMRHFRDAEDYRKFALENLGYMQENKKTERERRALGIDE